MKHVNYALPIVLTVLFCGCGTGDDGGGGSENNPVIPDRGERILGMDIKEIPSVTYAMAYDQAMALGVREVKVSLDWAALEPSVGHYDNTLPAIIDAFYPLQKGDRTLVLRPLDTAGPSMPAEFKGLAFDDPAVIAAFENYLTNLHSQLSTLNDSGKLKWINIGNEIDAYLGGNADRWAQWKSFFKAAKAKIVNLWGTGVEVSSIVQFSTLNDTAKLAMYLDLLPDLDNAVLTYYPLNADFKVRTVSSVATDFALMVKTLPGKTIVLQECGYPSGLVNSSNETLQADFTTAVFKAWDKYSNRISLIDLAWQYDVSPATVDQWVIDYEMAGDPNEAAFRGFLGTLGFGEYDGTEKEAMQRLRSELSVRKWVQ